MELQEKEAALVLLEAQMEDAMRNLQQNIQEELDAMEEPKDKFSLLYRYERQFKCGNNRRFLCEYIQAEICHLEKQEALMKMYPLLSDHPAVRPGGFKIRTTLSVESLAYLLKLMIQGKVIEQGVRTELLTFACCIFQTPNTGVNGISPISMGAKYKQVTFSTAVLVKAALVRMIKIIDNEF